jgi:hypothetical protein
MGVSPLSEDWMTIPAMTLHEIRALVPDGRVLVLDFANERMRLRARRDGEPEHKLTRLFDRREQG